MDIKGRIVQVEFVPNDYFRIRGMVNSKFNESRLWNTDSGDGFNLLWYWFESSMPPQVFQAFKNIINIIDTELQFIGIIPKRWPGALNDNDDDADIFNFKVTKYKLGNPQWLSGKEMRTTVTVTASSKWFTDDKALEKEINIRFHDDDLVALFKVLDEHL